MNLTALPYIRVSSKTQKPESQEHRCRKHCKAKGYPVEKAFVDKYTGGGDFMNRPAMKELLNYIDSNRDKKYVVVFDDLKRFDRDIEFHWKLRKAFRTRKVKIECLNFNFEDTPEGEFVETVLVAQGDLERKQNKRQVVQKMTARLERGYWPFSAPPGYVYVKDKFHGKLLVPDKAKADTVTEALEGFLSGRIETQASLRQFLQERDFYGGKTVHPERVRQLLRRAFIYAGYIEYAKWKVARRKGHHRPLIGLETAVRIEDKLSGKGRTHDRKIINEDFPLRRFVLCANCIRPLTACWSKGRHARYPYYLCRTKGCSMENRSIGRSLLQGQFEHILRDKLPAHDAVSLTKQVALSVWKKKLAETEFVREKNEHELRRVQEEKTKLVSRIPAAPSNHVAEAYEARIDELCRVEQLLQEKIAGAATTPSVCFRTALDEVCDYLKNPYANWVGGDIHERKRVLRLVFDEPLVYHQKEGFRTAKVTPPFLLFQLAEINDSRLVDIAGKISNRLEKYILEAWEAIKARDGKSGESGRRWKAAA